MSAETGTQNSGFQARATDQNNKKPFVYEEYIEKKYKIQQSIERRNRKWNLPNNFAKFELPPDVLRRSSKDLLESLIKAIGDDNKKAIKTFCPGQTPSFWLIALDSKESKERILQSNHIILDNIKITDANEKCPTPSVTCSGKFRIHKLPPHIQLATIYDYLKNKIKIKLFMYKNLLKEKYKDTDIENGVVSFQMSYSIEVHNQVQALIGANSITNEVRAFFQPYGHQSKCNICKIFGHQSRN